MRPYYEAIVALTKDKPELHLNTIPAEMREVTRMIIRSIEQRIPEKK